LIGINNRNGHLRSVIENNGHPQIPKGITVVAESGIFTASDVERLSKVNVDAILVGEALVTSQDIPAKVRELAGIEKSSAT
jgi:indole-3-glycerol phosphate synthase